MYSVHDWAEVHRLHREGLPQAGIARRLKMSRNTVSRLLKLSDPPAYARAAGPSMLDPYKDEIAAMLGSDPKVASTVILEHLRRRGYPGGRTILKDHLGEVRPQFLAARAFQRTSYLPGELSHGDWWHTGQHIPVGKGATREAFGWVMTLPHSAAHAVVYSFSMTMADLLAALLRCFERLGGVPEAIAVDNDSSIVATGKGRTAVLHPEVAALTGHLGLKVIVLEPGKPESKGQVERTNGYLETSFLPLRTFASLADLQAQSDHWTTEVAYRRHHRRVGARVGEAWMVEKGYLQALPDLLPDVDRRTEVRVTKDGFIRVGNVDYSVPPGLSGRRLGVRISPAEVIVHLEGKEIARHARSYVPADVVLAPAHARALRLARKARSRLRGGDVEVPVVDLGRYDRAFGISPARVVDQDVDPASENGSWGFSEGRSVEEVAR
ncbi:MAG: IS21 family transposase [Actinobacteria bacterium]|nr:IS21 family transposase [Actinomycetota bacterium]